MRNVCVILVCVLVLAVSVSYGEVIELIDGTKMSGRITHAYVHAVEVKCEGGEVLVIQLSKIKSPLSNHGLLLSFPLRKKVLSIFLSL